MRKICYLLVCLFSISLLAQKQVKKDDMMFNPVYHAFSGSKLSILHLKNGEKVEGYRRKVKFKKGQIYQIRIKDTLTGEKRDYTAEQIKEMYLYPSGFEKFTKVLAFSGDFRQWGSRDLEEDIIKGGYIYFKNQTISLKGRKDEKEYVIQLVNPSFSKYIEVYADPTAGKRGGFGVAINGIGVSTQGIDASYYIKKGEKTYFLKKKVLKKEWDSLFGDCPAFINKYKDKRIKWKDLGIYIYEYTEIKNNE